MKNKSALKWLVSALKKEISGIVLLTFLNSLISASSVLFAHDMKKIIDSAVSDNRPDFRLYAIIIGAIIIFQVSVRAVCRRTEEKTKSAIENKLKRRAYETILTRDFATLSDYHTGELQNKMTNDTVIIADGITTVLPNVTAMLVKIIGAVFVLMSLDSRFASIFVVGGILLLCNIFVP